MSAPAESENGDTPAPHGPLTERENLIPDNNVKKTGFTVRPIEKLAITKPSRTMTNIECNHFLRTQSRGSTPSQKTLEFALWQEAGKHDPAFPQRPDKQYNSNVWRNFRKSYGFHTSAEGQKMSEMIATMYPLNVPAASRIGDYTYAKFLKETPLIKDERRRQIAINRTSRDLQEFRRLRLRADVRDPPIDENGTNLELFYLQ